MWEQQLVETSRGVFEVFTKGEGEPLCVTHLYSEFNASGNLFADAFTPFYKVILVNLRSCGQSTDDVSQYTYSMRDSVHDIEAIRDALNIERWAFAGHSTGGMLALVYAIEAAQSLSFVVAGGHCASNAYMYNRASIYCSENPNNARIRDIMAMLANPASTVDERRAGSKEWSLMSLYEPSSFERMMSRPNSGKTVSKRLNYFTREDLNTFNVTPQLPNVHVRAYIYGGLHDAQCPYEYAAEVAKLMPNAELTTFARSNHFPFIEEEHAFSTFVTRIANDTTAI